MVATLCSSRTVHRTPRRARATVELLRQETPNFLAPNLWPPNSPDLSPVDYEIWAVMQRRVYHRQTLNGWIETAARRCLVTLVRSWIVDFWRDYSDQSRGRHQTYAHAKGHLEYSLWTGNVDFVHIICYSQCRVRLVWLLRYDTIVCI